MAGRAHLRRMSAGGLPALQLSGAACGKHYRCRGLAVHSMRGMQVGLAGARGVYGLRDRGIGTQSKGIGGRGGWQPGPSSGLAAAARVTGEGGGGRMQGGGAHRVKGVRSCAETHAECITNGVWVAGRIAAAGVITGRPLRRVATNWPGSAARRRNCRGAAPSKRAHSAAPAWDKAPGGASCPAVLQCSGCATVHFRRRRCPRPGTHPRACWRRHARPWR